MDGGPLRLPPRGEDGSVDLEHPTGRGGPGRYPNGGPGPRQMLTAAGDKHGGMAYGAAVHSK